MTCIRVKWKRKYGQDGTVQFVGGSDTESDDSSGALNKFVSKPICYNESRNPGGVQLFHVGRTVKSDINIVDYTISRAMRLLHTIMAPIH